MSSLALRPATPGDLPFLRAMLLAAAFWRPGRSPVVGAEDALDSPGLAVYLAGWGRAGDRGIVATAEGEPLGAVWYRTFSADHHGYGFLDTRTPELAMAVAAPHRGRGVGRALLAAALAQARLDGLMRLSLSVEAANPARALYEAAGFREVARAHGALTMAAHLG